MIETLEEFLVDQCGMAPTLLVEHYKEHREFIEARLQEYDGSDWQTYVEKHIWFFLPVLPKEFGVSE